MFFYGSFYYRNFELGGGVYEKENINCCAKCFKDIDGN